MLPPPMPPLPLDDPLRHPMEYVLGVGRDLHFAGLFERKQAWIGAISSIRLLVVRGSNPKNSFFTPPNRGTQAHPPGPGLPKTRAVGDQKHFLHAPGLGTVAPAHFLNFL